MADAPEISILLIGDAECGKRTFLSRISQGHQGVSSRSEAITLLRDGDQPYIFDITFFARAYRFSFYDTESPENWRLLRPDVVVICYDISSRLSLINVQRLWIKETQLAFPSPTLPILLLGLKRDLRSQSDPNGIIYPQEAYRVAQEMRCDKYMECSAVTGELVAEVFEDICRTAAMTTTEKGGQSEGACGVM